ncbi:hypothetical protein PR048_029620 [Dryococelus australis]|uniref:Uncharacterized protein n=1 Tax=Dryococelus australis TaxID=614101 RepID=A0ABQ9GFZ4_9NEOP|nr:hypothetical protein PR048_029620 [Dryococelus australis]
MRKVRGRKGVENKRENEAGSNMRKTPRDRMDERADMGESSRRNARKDKSKMAAVGEEWQSMKFLHDVIQYGRCGTPTPCQNTMAISRRMTRALRVFRVTCPPLYNAVSLPSGRHSSLVGRSQCDSTSLHGSSSDMNKGEARACSEVNIPHEIHGHEFHREIHTPTKIADISCRISARVSNVSITATPLTIPGASEEIWTALNIEVLRADDGEAGETGDPEKTRRPAASSGTIPTCENPVTRPGIEPSSPWWEASVLTAQPPWSPKILAKGNFVFKVIFRYSPYSFGFSLEDARCQHYNKPLVRLLAPPPPHQGEPGSIPGWVAPGFSHVGIVTDDAAGRRVFLGDLLPRPLIPALLHPHFAGLQVSVNTQLSSPHCLLNNYSSGKYIRKHTMGRDYLHVEGKWVYWCRIQDVAEFLYGGYVRMSDQSVTKVKCESMKNRDRMVKHDQMKSKMVARNKRAGSMAAGNKMAVGRSPSPIVNPVPLCEEARERYGRHCHARLAPHRSYAQGVQCFRSNARALTLTSDCGVCGVSLRDNPSHITRCRGKLADVARTRSHLEPPPLYRHVPSAALRGTCLIAAPPTPLKTLPVGTATLVEVADFPSAGHSSRRLSLGTSTTAGSGGCQTCIPVALTIWNSILQINAEIASAKGEERRAAKGLSRQNAFITQNAGSIIARLSKRYNDLPRRSSLLCPSLPPARAGRAKVSSADQRHVTIAFIVIVCFLSACLGIVHKNVSRLLGEARAEKRGRMLSDWLFSFLLFSARRNRRTCVTCCNLRVLTAQGRARSAFQYRSAHAFRGLEQLQAGGTHKFFHALYLITFSALLPTVSTSLTHFTPAVRVACGLSRAAMASRVRLCPRRRLHAYSTFAVISNSLAKSCQSSTSWVYHSTESSSGVYSPFTLSAHECGALSLWCSSPRIVKLSLHEAEEYPGKRLHTPARVVACEFDSSVDAVHDKVSPLETNLRKKSLPRHAYILMSAPSGIRPYEENANADITRYLLPYLVIVQGLVRELVYQVLCRLVWNIYITRYLLPYLVIVQGLVREPVYQVLCRLAKNAMTGAVQAGNGSYGRPCTSFYETWYCTRQSRPVHTLLSPRDTLTYVQISATRVSDTVHAQRRYYTIPDSVEACSRSAIRTSVVPAMAFLAL